jgi:predicted MFS family arabinose efflux permease
MAAPVPLRANHAFLLLWAAQALSLLGTSVSSLAYPLVLLERTGSAAQAGLVATALSLTALLAKVPAGRLVDARPGTRLMIAADAVRAVVVGMVALAVTTGSAWTALIVAAAAVEAAAGAVFGPAEFGVLRAVVAPAQRRDAVTRSQSRAQLAGLLGPAAGGALYAIQPGLPFVVDAASYVISLLLVLGVRHRPASAAPGPVGPARAGWRWLRHESGLWAAAWWTAGLTATFTAVGFVLLVLARSRGADPHALGALYSISAAGGLAGSLVAPRLIARWPGRTVLRGAAWVDAAATLALLPARSPYVIGLIGFAAFFLVPAVSSALLGQLAVACPPALVGRAQAVLTLVLGCFAPLAAPVAGGVADAVGAAAVVAGCAGTFLVLAVTASLRPLLD